MYGCEVLFDAETAAKIRNEIRSKMGFCPCDKGLRCPLLPDPIFPDQPPRSSSPSTT